MTCAESSGLTSAILVTHAADLPSFASLPIPVLFSSVPPLFSASIWYFINEVIALSMALSALLLFSLFSFFLGGTRSVCLYV